MHLQNRSGRVAQEGHALIAERRETARCRLDPFGERQPFGQGIQLPVQDHQGIGPQTFQRLGRHLRRDSRVTIAIATHPGPKTQGRHTRTGCQSGHRQARPFPGILEAAVQLGHHIGQHVAQVVEDVAALVGHGGLFDEDLARPPEAFQQHGQLDPVGTAGPGLTGALEQLHEHAVLLQHGRTLGLSGMRREDRLHLHAAEGLQDRFRSASRPDQLHQLISPKAPLGLGRSRLLAPVAQGLRDALFDRVEKLKCHGQGQAQPGGRLPLSGKRRVGLGGPRNPSGQFALTQSREHLDQRIGQPTDILIDLAESPLDGVKGHGILWRGCGHGIG